MTPSAEILCNLKVQQQLCRQPAVLCRDATMLAVSCVAPSVSCRLENIAPTQICANHTSHQLPHGYSSSPTWPAFPLLPPPPLSPLILAFSEGFPGHLFRFPLSCRRATTKAVSGLDMSYYKILIWGANCENEVHASKTKYIICL